MAAPEFKTATFLEELVQKLGPKGESVVEDVEEVEVKIGEDAKDVVEEVVKAYDEKDVVEPTDEVLTEALKTAKLSLSPAKSLEVLNELYGSTTKETRTVLLKKLVLVVQKVGGATTFLAAVKPSGTTTTESTTVAPSSTEVKRKSFFQTFVSNVTDATTAATSSVTTAFTSKRQSTVDSLEGEPITTPENVAAATTFATESSKYTSPGWWDRLVETVTSFQPTFNSFTFVKTLAEGPAEVEVGEAFEKSGAPLSETQVEEVKMTVHPGEPEQAGEALKVVAKTAKSMGPENFFRSVLPLALRNPVLDEELDISEAYQRIQNVFPGSVLNIYEFTSQCQLTAPNFDVNVFLETLSSDAGPVTEQRLDQAFKAAGLDTTEAERHHLTEVLFGEWNPRLMHYWLKLLREVGVFEFLLGYPDVLPEGRGPSQEQAGRAAKAFITNVYDRGQNVKFDVAGFQRACRALNPAFHYDLFLENLSLEDTSMDMKALKKSGLTLTDNEYNSVLDALCGDKNQGLAVMREWSQYLRLWGQENFTAVIDTTLAERKEKNKLMRSFLGRIYALEGRPQFNLRGFEAACKNRNPKFDLQAFCDTLANLPPVESDSFEQCFEAAGIEIDPQSPEYKELLVTLFGDIDVAPAAAREWRHFLRTVGSDWSVLSLWTHLDQRQQVEGAVKQFVTDTTSLTADASSKKKRTIRLTLRAFIERCQNLEQSWRSDITFDLRVFLEKLTDMQGDVNFGSIVAVLKACGVNTTEDEYRDVIGSIASGDYETGLEIFKRLAAFLKAWGSDWNMWIVWAILDEKVEGVEETTEVVIPVVAPAVEPEVAPKEEEVVPAKAAKKSWFTQLVETVSEGAEAVTNTVTSTALQATDFVVETITGKDDDDEEDDKKKAETIEPKP